MGTFSASHWAIALVLLAGLGYFTYLIGSLLCSGAKASGSKWKLWVVVLLVPVVILTVASFTKAYTVAKPTAEEVEWWKKGSTPLN
jgi:hypothetical protein